MIRRAVASDLDDDSVGKSGRDVVFMPESVEGYKFIVFGRDNLSGCVEGCTLKENTAQNVAGFCMRR